MMIEMREKLERIFVERALLEPVKKKLERMSLAELLYHAVMECGEECRRMHSGAMQQA